VMHVTRVARGQVAVSDGLDPFGAGVVE